MGNSQTKESRPLASSNRRHHHGPYGDRHHADGSRSNRGSRPDLSILGIGGSSERDLATLEHRRETRQEREARKLEKERVARLKERERSMKEEHVDGGYLVTQGVYTGPEDFNKAVVRQLMIERRLAPFWRGLNDFSDSWTEHQLMAAARGLPIPPPDEIPPELEYRNPPKAAEDAKEASDSAAVQYLMVPITSRSQSYGSDASQSSTPAHSLPSPTSPIASGTSSSPLFRTRAKTLASLTTPKHGISSDSASREIQLPRDPFVNGQPIEAYLYKDAAECPICFLYYPPYLNRTRCCDQPICSECFVQIKRPDPHPPEHGDANPDSAPADGGEHPESQDCQLVSEPSACPFCVQPEFGVTYAPPSFRRGLAYASDPSSRPNITSPLSSTSSLSSGNTPVTGRRRATSLSANDPTVITTDRIRPDWAQKLANARAHAARRSAAATALHTAAYLMHSNGTGGDSRNFGLGRRSVMRRNGAPEAHNATARTGSPALQALAFLTDRRGAGHETDSAEEGPGNIAPPRHSSRRNRIDDLEEMMMMEAIRLSLASEEERRKKEEKEAKKEAKRKEKEAKKADKVARKIGLTSNNASSSALDVPPDGRLGRVTSSSSSIADEAASARKGKEVDRASPIAPVGVLPAGSSAAVEGVQFPSVSIAPVDQPPSMSPSPIVQSSSKEITRPSHLRHVSSASSSFSSLVESMTEDPAGPHASAEGAGPFAEPLFNFRSLAAVIGDEEKGDEVPEYVEGTTSRSNAEGSTSQSVHAAADASSSEAATTGAAGVPVEEEHCNSLMPKELEAQSVEITGATHDMETTS
ncbi:C2H2 zinc finger protein [Aspergillus sclerotioniger CBS 115572]|uniref:Protein SIP5 n=1 Tax=Aspergillus sclerotioniger CBS 115572 TaxID=1450535 RepID=A0A317VDS2_9EURO|nr:C2H2 zinc finger protein [Aspergillus sclerotioniger CBS 115572]PWY72523.1 C2H2 zinc finger protein [Aspergillus sclerotioniger CBS 115572]